MYFYLRQDLTVWPRHALGYVAKVGPSALDSPVSSSLVLSSQICVTLLHYWNSLDSKIPLCALLMCLFWFLFSSLPITLSPQHCMYFDLPVISGRCISAALSSLQKILVLATPEIICVASKEKLGAPVHLASTFFFCQETIKKKKNLLSHSYHLMLNSQAAFIFFHGFELTIDGALSNLALRFLHMASPEE